MKIFQLIGSGVLATVLFSGVALADEGRNGRDEGMMGGDDDYPMMSQQRFQISNDMMTMMKDVMGILKNLNHKPADAEKERLAKVMGKLDEMMATHKEMNEKANEMRKERRKNWEERKKMRDD